MNHSGHNYIGSEHLLLGLLREGEGVAARVLENLGADPSNIRTQVRTDLFSFSVKLGFTYCRKNMLKLYWGGQVIRMVGENTDAVGAGVGGGSSGNKMPTLEEYGTNLTKLAEEVCFAIFTILVAYYEVVLLCHELFL